MNHNLTENLNNLNYEVKATLPSIINNIQSNSSFIKKNDLFIAIKGLTSDGHQYLQECQKTGAVAIIVEQFSGQISIPIIKVPDTKKALHTIANIYYQGLMDDKFTSIFMEKANTECIGYPLYNPSETTFSQETTSDIGIKGKLIFAEKKYEFYSPSSCKFNKRKLLAVISTCYKLNIPMIYILKVIRNISAPKSRLEEITHEIN